MKYAIIIGKVIGVLVFVVLLYFGWRVFVAKEDLGGAKVEDAANSEVDDSIDNMMKDQELDAKRLAPVKLENGQEISGVGYFAEIIMQKKIADGSYLVLIKSFPCGECDSPADLLLHSTAIKKSVTASLPGKYTYAESKDPDQIVFAFFGQCTDSANPSLISLHKIKEGEGPWKAEQVIYTFNGKDFEQKPTPIEVQDVERLRNEFSKKSSCEEIKGQDQSYL